MTSPAGNATNLIINGRYHLHEKLGQGGMGAVYKATDRLSGEIVALKQVTNLVEQAAKDTAVSADDLRLALAHEFQTLAGLRHPHIISVLDYGFDAERQPFFTMTYLSESQTILAAAQDQPLDDKIKLIEQLLQALAYLHRRGVLHRDLKPENVLVQDHTVRLLDFGLAASEQIGSSASTGTPLYMAPELYEGGSYSEAADLYAAGVLFYQLLTGEHPFAPFDFAFLDRVVEEEPDWSEIEERLRPFLSQLLAKEPADRFASANVALTALAEALNQPPPADTHAIRESYLQAAKFVGREAEMAQLTEALEQAAAGNGSAWVIGGESGVGKTRLINELRTQALVAGFQVLRGQTSEDGGLPYVAWREPARQLVATLPIIDDLTASILLPLVPDMAQLLGREVEPAPELKEDAAQTRLFTTIARLFWRAERPLLLILEDLHMAEASLLPLPFLTRLIRNYSLLILGSYRSDERPNLPSELPEMTHLPLARLSPEAMADLSVAMLGEGGRDEEIQALLQRETEGNAFFAVEVVRALADEAGRLGDIGQMQLPETLLPNGIQDIVQRRVGRLPDEAKQLLVKTAVAGRELELPLIQQLANGIDVKNWWLPLCADAAVLEVHDNGWRFSHGKIRDGLLAELPSERLRGYYRLVAQAVENIYPDDANQAVRLTHYWGRAGDKDRERQFAYLAGKQAVDQFANAEAVNYLNRALALTSDDDLSGQYEIQLMLEAAYHLLGQREKQATIIDKLEKIADALAEPEKQVEIFLRHAQYNAHMNQFPAAIAAAQRVIAFPQAMEKDHASAYYTWGWALSRLGDWDEAQSLLRQSLIISREIGDKKSEVSSLLAMGAVAVSLGDIEEAQQFFTVSLKASKETGSQAFVSVPLNNLGYIAGERGEFEQANQYLEASLANSLEVGDQYNEATIRYNLGDIAFRREDFVNAELHLAASLAKGREIKFLEVERYSLHKLGIVAYLQGKYSEASTYYQQALALCQKLNQPHFMVEEWAGLAQVAVAQGEEATTYLDDVMNYIAQEPQLEGAEHPFLVFLQAYQCLEASDDDRATTLLAQASQLLQERAAKIKDEKSRHSFLENVAENREILRLYEEMKEDTAVSNTLQPTKPARSEEEIIEQYLFPDEAEDEPAPKLRGEALLTHLLAVSRYMAAMRSVAPLLSYAMYEVLQLVGAEQGYIVLINDDGSLDFRVRQLADGTQIQSDADTISRSVLDEVLRTQESLVVRNALLDPRFGEAHSVMAMQLRSIMCAPLITQDRIIGAIYVENRSKSGRFSDEDLAPLEFFSNQAAVAIENANLNENLENLVAERTWELAEAKEVAEAANEAKTQFLSNMSHELRTPLNAILNFTGFVQDGLYGGVNEEQKTALQQALDSGEHLLSLINDILDLNKVEAGMTRLIFEPIDLNKTMQHAVSTAKGLIKDQPIELVVDIAENLPTIQADRRRLRQILLNILSNAAKYTEQGTITICARQLVAEKSVEIVVKDSGVGIVAEDHHLVFEAYGQARANVSNVVSTGLGMAITHELVALHGGRIWFESEPGLGTTFYVHLPVTQDNE
ncbi:BREX system ATP-binding domain-containing protein [Candidatus Leptofilum sp.]|uniref:BREX system ATP-binding domain-containing protein n=1 Tax=Candidatus Leptofilum sp. TaxID=3241576 RepID=UPI003B5AFEBA